MLLVYLTAAWILGMLLSRFLWVRGVIGCAAPSLWVWGAISAALVVSAVLLRRQRRVRIALILFLFALLGAWRYQSHPLQSCFTLSDLAYYNGTEREPAWVTVEGVITDYPNVGERTTSYEVRVHSLEKDGTRRELSGMLLLQTSRFAEFQYGDQVRFSGLLQTPPCYDGFCWRDHLARQSIHSLISHPGKIELLAQDQGNPIRATLYSFREHVSGTINRILPEPSAALLNGILLGIESGIPKRLYGDFNATGTSHIIVISGFNLSQTG